MSTHVIDKLILELGIDGTKFKSDAQKVTAINDRLEESIDGVEKTSDKASDSVSKFGDSNKKASKESINLSNRLGMVAKQATAFFAVLLGSNALVKFTNDIAAANDNLNFLSKNLGTNADTLKKWGNAAAALGGTAEGMQNTFKNLGKGIEKMRMTGDSSMLPYFNAMQVALVDARGKARELDDVLLDMSDSLSKMDRKQAYNLADMMGLDEGTTNALLSGKEAMQEMLAMQKNLRTSTAAEMDASRELRKSQAILGAQWEGLKLTIGNAIIPLLTKLTKWASTFVQYLQKNENVVKNFFLGMSAVIGLVLIPMLLKGALAFAAFVAPIVGAAAIVAALGSAFLLLLDDYMTWAAGGNSAFDWTAFDKFIKATNVSVGSLTSGLTYLLTGYKTWAEAGNSLFDWLRMRGFIDENGKMVNNLGDAFLKLGRDVFTSLPILRDFSEIIGLILDGEFSAAGKKVLELPAKMAQAGLGATNWVAGHVASAVDTSLGIDPNSDAGLAQQARNLKQWNTGVLNKGIGMLPSYAQPTAGKYDNKQGGGDKYGGSATDQALALIRKHEGFSTGTYWDVNAHRLGYGSDTITNADGSHRRVKKGDKVTREGAERDLRRRTNDFASAARNKVGAAAWDKLNPATQASLTSVAYNYGSLDKLTSVVNAARSGDNKKVAGAIRNLEGHNSGVNKSRRNQEADYVLNNSGFNGAMQAQGMVNKSTVPPLLQKPSSQGSNVNVSINGGINVNTSANTLQGVTTSAVEAGVSRVGNLGQLTSGLA